MLKNSEQKMHYPILLYHGIHSEAHPYRCRDQAELEWVIDIDAFRRQMEILAQSGVTVVLLNQLHGIARVSTAREKPIVLTFDDGHETNFLNALPVLNQFGFKAEFFITAGWVGRQRYMDSIQLRELKQQGMSVQSHAFTHSFLTELKNDELTRELSSSKQIISEIISDEVAYISYPGGRYNSTVERLALATGYTGSCTSDRGYNQMEGTAFGLKRLGLTPLTTDKHFTALVNNDQMYLWKLQMKAGFSSAAHSLLGPSTYDRLNALRKRLQQPRV
ncbi:MAG: polysaccharide deacetylase family protein [Anaerolineaceae bacterium]